VNVSSGTGSPGCPVQNPESRKMVVFVVAYVYSSVVSTKLILSTYVTDSVS